MVTNAAGEITWQAGRALRFDAGGRLHQQRRQRSRHWYNGQHQRVLKDEPTGQMVYAYGLTASEAYKMDSQQVMRSLSHQDRCNRKRKSELTQTCETASFR